MNYSLGPVAARRRGGGGGGGPTTYWTAEALSEVTDTTGSWVDLVTLSIPDSQQEASTDYLIIWTCDAKQTSSSNKVGVRLTIDAAETVLNLFEPRSANNYQQMGGLHVFASGSTPATKTLKIQFQRNTAAGTAYARNARVSVIKLGANDEHGTTTARTTTTSSTYSAAATLNFTPPSSGDYIILACGVVDTESADGRVGVRLHDGTVNTEGFVLRVDDTTTLNPCFLIWRRNGLSGAQAMVLQFASLSGSYTVGIREMRMLALRVDDFANVYYAELGANSDGDEATFTTVLTNSFTPASGGHLSLASWAVGASQNTAQTESRLVDDALEVNLALTSHPTGLGTHLQGFASVLAQFAASARTQVLQRRAVSGSDKRIAQNSAIVTFDLSDR